MKVVSFSFDVSAKTWSVPALPSNLDSERTLVLAFGPPGEVTFANQSEQSCTYLVVLARS